MEVGRRRRRPRCDGDRVGAPGPAHDPGREAREGHGASAHKSCRICFGTDSDSDFDSDSDSDSNTGFASEAPSPSPPPSRSPVPSSLISPCLCSGSCKWVHRECLDEWRRHGLRRRSAAHRECQTCGFEYVTQRGRLSLVARRVRGGLAMALKPCLCLYVMVAFGSTWSVHALPKMLLVPVGAAVYPCVMVWAATRRSPLDSRMGTALWTLNACVALVAFLHEFHRAGGVVEALYVVLLSLCQVTSLVVILVGLAHQLTVALPRIPCGGSSSPGALAPVLSVP